jgi:GNAT superfamily N-acetyltransferase
MNLNPKLQIDIGQRADVEALVGFNRAMARETEDKALDLEILTAGVQAMLDEPARGFYVVARDNQAEELVGSLMVTREWSDWRCGDFWWIQSVYVRPAARRQGVYRRLYDFVRERATGAGNVCGFRLYVERDNHRAQQTYEALGMSQTVYLMYEGPAVPPPPGKALT